MSRIKDLKHSIDGRPLCPVCGKAMIFARDSKTGKFSKYLFKSSCKHLPSILVMNRG